MRENLIRFWKRSVFSPNGDEQIGAPTSFLHNYFAIAIENDSLDFLIFLREEKNALQMSGKSRVIQIWLKLW